ncbi:MAG: AIR synthase family protein [Candidatus Methanodesulfokora sp.]
MEKLGKLSSDIFNEIIYPNLGKKDRSVVVPPKHGVDFGVVELGDLALIVKSDPVFVVPEYGWDRSSWFAVHILASDVSVSGVPPRYLSIDLNLPPKMSKEEFRLLWTGISRECERLGISIVAGHTGKYEGTDYPMVGGATMLAITTRDQYVTTEMARPGDLVIMTKGPAVEAAGILSTMFPEYLEKKFGKEFADRAKDIFYLQSVVEDALTLSSIGLRTGVTSMHDATEYGVWGALYDVARASNVGIVVRKKGLFIREDVKTIISAFSELTGIKADPFAAISEGTLIATVKPEKAPEALRKLREKGIEAGIIGEVVEREGVFMEDGRAVEMPSEDPFWPMFFRTVEMLKRK